MLDYFESCYESYDYSVTGVVPYTVARSLPSLTKIKKLDFWKQAGLWGKDEITPIFSHTWKTALESANNCYCVKNFVKKGEKSVTYCLNMYPGHHSEHSVYGGYCFLNNGAICAKSLQANGFGNIAILDLDYHVGDGTEDIFREDPTVTTVSIHADTNFDYPFYSSDAGTQYCNRIKNLTFGPNTLFEEYIQLVGSALDFINTNKIDALIIAFGGDTYKNDPDASSSCRCGLDIPDYELIGRHIMENIESDVPIIVTQEGGYNMEHMDKISYSFLKGLTKN